MSFDYFVPTSQGKISLWDSDKKAKSDAPCVLFLHGHLTNKTFFSEQMKEDALKGFRKIALDLPGYGKSDVPKEPLKVYSFPGFAGVVAEVIERLDLHNVAVVGWSLGGHVAMELAAIEKKLKAILITGAPPIEVSLEGLGRGFRVADPRALACFGKGNLTEEEAAILATIAGYDYTKEKRFMVDAVLEADEGAKTLYPASIAKGIGLNEVEFVRTYPKPIAVIAGEKDSGINNDYILHEVQFGNLWSGKIHVIKEAGHAVQRDAPQEFNAIVARFLSDILLYTK